MKARDGIQDGENVSIEVPKVISTSAGIVMTIKAPSGLFKDTRVLTMTRMEAIELSHILSMVAVEAICRDHQEKPSRPPNG